MKRQRKEGYQMVQSCVYFQEPVKRSSERERDGESQGVQGLIFRSLYA